MIRILAAISLALITLTPAQAKHKEMMWYGFDFAQSQGYSARHHRQVLHRTVYHPRHSRTRNHGAAKAIGRDLVTVPTAAGITITIDRGVAPAMQAFISDLVLETGYRPRRISCYSMARSHVARSNHKWGGACDFDQTGWNRTARAMYRVRHIAVRHGLRDGCSFRDCGHIDMPRSRYARR